MGTRRRDNNQDSSTPQSQGRESNEDRERIPRRTGDKTSDDSSDGASPVFSQDYQDKPEGEGTALDVSQRLFEVPAETGKTEKSNENKATVLLSAVIGLMTGFGLGIVASHLMRKRQEPESFHEPLYKPFEVILGGKR